MKVRTTFIILTTLLAVWVAPALGQQRTPTSGTIDLGVRFTDVSGDAARFQRFRDLGDGAFLERLRFDRQRDRWLVNISADHVGRLDQRYGAEFIHSDRMNISFQWDQIPLFVSRDTRTPYVVESQGVLRLADGLQQGVQSGQLLLSDVVSGARAFDSKSRRDIARLSVRFSPRRDLDLRFNLTNTLRDGTMPLGTLFSASNTIELPAPIDSRTTDVASGIEWTGTRGSLRVGYDASWFNNSASTLVWDNPMRFTDAAALPSQGRYALAPDSTLHSVTTAGALKLPANSRMTASATVGTWRQDDALLPFTINTALATIPLDRATTEGEVRTLAMNYNFTSRPTQYVWLNARYRYYDLDNRTPEFHMPQRAVNDSSISNFARGTTEALSYTRQNFDVDMSVTPVPFTALRAGYSRDWTDRTHRIFARTTEDTVRASIDSTAPQWLTLRAIVERSKRTGTGFDEGSLLAVNEQPAMRHFDIADRDRDRVTGLIQLTPTPVVGVSASAAIGHDDYRNSGFGLRDSKSRVYSTSLDLTPGESVVAGVSYSYERYTALHNSRSAAPGAEFTDPRRNWADDTADKVHTVWTNFDLLRLPGRSELHLSYDFTQSRATYVYILPADSVLAAPAQLPPVRNDLQSGTADYRIALTEQLSIGVMYWHDRYTVEDFQLGPERADPLIQPGTVLMGYVYRPYTANSGWIRLIVSWR